MASTYPLEIITPEKIFFEGMVESVIVPSEEWTHECLERTRTDCYCNCRWAD